MIRTWQLGASKGAQTSNYSPHLAARSKHTRPETSTPSQPRPCSSVRARGPYHLSQAKPVSMVRTHAGTQTSSPLLMPYLAAFGVGTGISKAFCPFTTHTWQLGASKACGFGGEAARGSVPNQAMLMGDLGRGGEDSEGHCQLDCSVRPLSGGPAEQRCTFTLNYKSLIQRQYAPAASKWDFCMPKSGMTEGAHNAARRQNSPCLTARQPRQNADSNCWGIALTRVKAAVRTTKVETAWRR
eukprot:1157645-Pelagomonas_calceolata.AAC.3